MTEPEFYDLVKRMRETQKDYFRSRSPDVLQQSKALEREVDDAVEAYYAPPGLFDAGGESG